MTRHVTEPTIPGVTAREVQKSRERLGLNRAAFARAMGTTRVTVWRWENGEHAISSVAQQLLKILLDSPRSAA